MAASNPNGEQKFWHKGLPFGGVIKGTNTANEQKFWFKGMPFSWLLPPAVITLTLSETLSVTDNLIRQAGKFLSELLSIVDTRAVVKPVFKQATVNASLVASSQTDFPAYVDLSRIGITTLAEAQSVRVYADSLKTTELAREIVTASEMWVKISSLTTTTTIYVDYDGVRADYGVTATYGRNNVWTGYDMVLHAQSDRVDATGKRTLGQVGTTAYAAGQIGNGFNIPDTANYPTVPDAADIDYTGNMYYRSWVKRNDTTNLDSFFSKGSPWTAGNGYWMHFSDGSNAIAINTPGSSFANTTLTTGGGIDAVTAKKLIVMKKTSATNIKLLSNGVLHNTVGVTAAFTTNANDMRVGNRTDADDIWDGWMDEVRFSSTIYSDNWDLTQYNNESDEASFWGTWTTVSSGTTYNENRTETIVIVDTLSRNAGRLLGETITVMDSIFRSVARSFAEAVTLIDSVSRSVSRALSEVVTVVDTVRVRISAKILNEAITVVDTVSRSLNRALSEVLTIVDTVARNTGRLLNEVVLLVDTITATKVTSRAFSEAVTIVDTFSRNISRAFSEVVTIVDSVARTTGKFFSDALTVIDSVATTKVTARAFTEVITVVDTVIAKITARMLTEVLTIVDTLNRAPARAFQEVVTVVDTVNKSISKSFAEALTVVDSIRRSVSRSLTETLTVVDTLSRQVARTFTEVVTVLDTVATLLFTIISIVRTETITVVDTLSRATGRLLFEAVTVTDSLVRTAGRGLIEAITVVDTFARSVSISKLLSEAITVVDTVRARISARMLFEAITVTDTVSRSVARFLTESIIVRDILSFLKAARGFILGRDNDTNTGIGKRRTGYLGRDNDTGTGIGRRRKPQVGRDNDTNTGIGKKLH